MTAHERKRRRPAALSLDPDRLYRGATYRPDGPAAQRIRSSYAVVAAPGQRPQGPPQVGDLLVRIALGVPGAGRLAVIGDDQACCRLLDRTGRMPLGQLLLRSASSTAEQHEEAVLRTGPLNDGEWALLESVAGGRPGWHRRPDLATPNAKPRSSPEPSSAGARSARPIGGRSAAVRRSGGHRRRPSCCRAADARRRPADRSSTGLAPEARRPAYVMNLLVGTYGYPVNGPPGLVGNLWAESAVLPEPDRGQRPGEPDAGPRFPCRAHRLLGGRRDEPQSPAPRGPRRAGHRFGPVDLARAAGRLVRSPARRAAGRRADPVRHGRPGRLPGDRAAHELRGQSYCGAEGSPR